MNKKKYLIAELAGGLGNQLFIFFAAEYFSKITGRDLILDCSHVDFNHSKFDICSLNISNRVTRKRQTKLNKFFKRVKDFINYRFKFVYFLLFREQIIGDEIILETSKILTLKCKRIRLRGFFHNFEYFEKVKTDVLKKIIDYDKTYRCTDYFQKLESSDKYTIGIHVRRGDYLATPETLGNLDSKYYVEILQEIEKSHACSKALLFIFTDDLKYCEDLVLNSSYSGKVIYRVSKKEEDPMHDLILMSNLDLLYISNSTFAIVAGLICAGQVIAPSPIRKKQRPHENFDVNFPTSWKVLPARWTL